MKKLALYIFLSFIASSALLSTIDAVADVASGRVTLGGGYTCDVEGKLIYKGNGKKPVTLKKAKDALNQKISELGSSKKDKAKKAVLKTAKAQLKPCTDGTLSLETPTPTPTSDDSKKPGNDDFCRAHPKHPKCR